jgi:mannitol-1-/sugar-/sorbitol-6-phosphatase
MVQIQCKGVLVDMDGVLVDSTAAVARVWTRWAQRHNMNPNQAVLFAHGRKSLDTIRELLPQADAATHMAENEWMERGEIEDIADVIALPGAKELLAGLAPAQVAVVTSATRALAEVRLRAAGLWDYVHHLVTASDIERGKPDPEPYQKGAASLALPPQDCIVIEDAPSGVRAGKTAGARVVGVRTTTDDRAMLDAGANWVVNDCSAIHASNHASPQAVTLRLSFDEPRREPKMR